MIDLAGARLAALAFVLALLSSAPLAPPARAQDAPPAAAEVAEPVDTVEAPAPPYADGAELTVLNLINLKRLEYGLSPLESDATLIDLARFRSVIMAETGRVEHDIPGLGFGPVWLISQLRGPGLGRVGENLGATNLSNDVAMWALFDDWIASPTHLENIIRPEYRRVGVGVVEVPTRFPGLTLKFVTQVFAVASGPLSRV